MVRCACFRADQLIQTAIRTQFNNCTIVTVAHRLMTVMDTDRILVVRQAHATKMCVCVRIHTRTCTYMCLHCTVGALPED